MTAPDNHTNYPQNPPQTDPRYEPRTGRLGIPYMGKLVILVGGQLQNPIEIDLSGTEGYVLGRSDARSSYIPDVDLAPYRALDRGISRRHCALVTYHGRLHVVDLSSINGTFIGGNRLTPELAYPLHPNDRLTLGELEMLVSPSPFSPPSAKS